MAYMSMLLVSDVLLSSRFFSFPSQSFSKMISFVVLVTILGFGSFSSVLGALDPDGVPYSDDPIVLKHQAEQAQLKNYEHKQRNGKTPSLEPRTY